MLNLDAVLARRLAMHSFKCRRLDDSMVRRLGASASAAFVVLTFLSSFASGCSDSHDSKSCVPDLNYGLVLEVVDDSSDEEICDAEVTATSHDPNEVARIDPRRGCPYYGMPEQHGTFSVTVTKPGYVSQTVEIDIALGKGIDGCGAPVTRHATVRLVPVGD
jgi:hypothetical protein